MLKSLKFIVKITKKKKNYKTNVIEKNIEKN